MINNQQLMHHIYKRNKKYKVIMSLKLLYGYNFNLLYRTQQDNRNIMQ